MREIKFRTWDKDRNYMFYDVQDEFNQSKTPFLCFGEVLADERCEVMQYTGLKDTSGNEIYEGDIINTYKGNFTVEWDEIGGMFLFHEVKTNDPDGLLGIDYYEFEEVYSYYEFVVIGNVYENPELLEDGQNG